MTRKAVVAGLLVVGGAGAFAGLGRAELPRHCARPLPLPGIPCYDYKGTATPKPTVTAVSLTKVSFLPDPVPVVTPVVVGGTTFAVDVARTQPPPQLYQLLESRLQVDHCFLSRVAVAFHQDGAFQISFRADQDPQPGNDIRSPLKPGEQVATTIQTSHLKRNQFVVKVRGYAAFPATGVRPGQGLAAPVLVEFPLEPFWVQKGEPYSGFVTGRSDAVRKYYNSIDRIEVEFTYR